jgi:hypothetical protein
MSNPAQLPRFGNLRATLLAATAITTAVANQVSDVVLGLVGMRYLIAEAKFVYGSDGTTATAWVQTSIDGGVTWIDILCFQFTTASASKLFAVTATPATPLGVSVTPGDAALAANSIVDGVLGDRLRVKYTTTGTYGGTTTLSVDVIAKG